MERHAHGSLPARQVDREGAQAKIDDGLFDHFPKPAVVLGQHVMPAPAGTVSYRPGTTQAASDSLQIRMFGRGGHGSMPAVRTSRCTAPSFFVVSLRTLEASSSTVLTAKRFDHYEFVVRSL